MQRKQNPHSLCLLGVYRLWEENFILKLHNILSSRDKCYEKKTRKGAKKIGEILFYTLWFENVSVRKCHLNQDVSEVCWIIKLCKDMEEKNYKQFALMPEVKKKKNVCV